MSRFKVPHTLVLLFGMIVLAYVLTLLVPQGEFESDPENARKIVAGTYHAVDEPLLRPHQIFAKIPKGFEAAGHIIFFVFIVGGAFGVFRATGAADAAIGSVLNNLGNYPRLLVFCGMFIFAAGSATIGMAEEYIPFVPLLLALAIGLGFDAVTAIGILCVGYGVGYGCAFINPFTVLIAQDVAGVAPASGYVYRLILGAVFLAVGFHHVWSYAAKVKADPSRSLVADIEPDPHLKKHDAPPLTTRHVLILLAFLAVMIIMVIGIQRFEWYLDELGAMFLGLTILWAIIGKLSPDKTASEFCFGAAELTTTALLIGVARTIEIVLNDGHVVHTIIHAVAQPLESMGPELAASGMYFFQSLCNLFIPSGSGQAFVTMPIMAPLADLVQVSRQTAVLAYQFGDGFTNIIVPTNAVLVGILAMARIPYDRWFRFILPFIIKVWILGALALTVAVWLGY